MTFPARPPDPRRLSAPPPAARPARRVLREKLPFAALAGARRRSSPSRAQRGVPEMRTLAEHGLAARLAQAAYGLCFYLVATLAPGRAPPGVLARTPASTRPRRATSPRCVAVAGASRPPPCSSAAAAPWLLADLGGLRRDRRTGARARADRPAARRRSLHVSRAACRGRRSLTAGLARCGRPRRSPRCGAPSPPRAAAVLAILAAAHLPSDARLARLRSRSGTTRSDSIPDNWVAYTNRGWARSDDPDAAIADYSAAIALQPALLPAVLQSRQRAPRARRPRGCDRRSLHRDRALPGRSARPTTIAGGHARRAGTGAGAAADYERALEVAAPDWWGRDLVLGNLAAARARMHRQRSLTDPSPRRGLQGCGHGALRDREEGRLVGELPALACLCAVHRPRITHSSAADVDVGRHVGDRRPTGRRTPSGSGRSSRRAAWSSAGRRRRRPARRGSCSASTWRSGPRSSRSPATTR